MSGALSSPSHTQAWLRENVKKQPLVFVICCSNLIVFK